MGYIRHHAIIITSTNNTSIEDAHKKAIGIFGVVSPILDSRINGYRSFLVPPDGSKEWWLDSDKGDKNREAFISIIRDDMFLDWAEIQYGDDEGVTRIVSHSDEFHEGF